MAKVEAAAAVAAAARKPGRRQPMPPRLRRLQRRPRRRQQKVPSRSSAKISAGICCLHTRSCLAPSTPREKVTTTAPRRRRQEVTLLRRRRQTQRLRRAALLRSTSPSPRCQTGCSEEEDDGVGGEVEESHTLLHRSRRLRNYTGEKEGEGNNCRVLLESFVWNKYRRPNKRNTARRDT
ncbi:hypothetical protein BX600DRAFT_476799 [Xylariales sp. PMI_506]|nr:hypothetical protein BX600DRAFT_476799 [Xylariales sp. PMI_506]